MNEKRHPGLFRKKHILIVTFAIVVMVIFVLLYMFISSMNKSSSVGPQAKRVAPMTEVVDEKLSKNGIELVNSIKLIGQEDEQSFKSGDNVKVSIKLSNAADQQSRFLTLKTSLNPKNFYDIRNMKGITGLAREKDQLVIKNVSTQANQSQEMSFEATLNFSENTDLIFSTELLDMENTTVTKSNEVNYKVAEG